MLIEYPKYTCPHPHPPPPTHSTLPPVSQDKPPYQQLSNTFRLPRPLSDCQMSRMFVRQIIMTFRMILYKLNGLSPWPLLFSRVMDAVTIVPRHEVPRNGAFVTSCNPRGVDANTKHQLPPLAHFLYQ